ncbi:MAG: alpha/beta fold hydrolase [Actinobacteria bacterium]|nr:alpha/beta fold hydrolase [Actinomycetota bacterium]
MVMGYGAQLIAWPRGFSEMLAAGGRFVIEFDNRDSGLSSKLDGVEVEMDALLAAARAGDRARVAELAPYTLSDLATDAAALLDALGIDRAHVLGASMGAMIAQQMAIERPERLLSLVSMMSTTGEPEFGAPSPQALEALLTPSPAERAAYIESSGAKGMIWASRRYGDRTRLEALAAAGYDRCFYPQGVSRQLAAILATGSRADGLRALDVPTLVIHGLDDTLIAPDGGERTAELIPGARLLLVEDMGHDRPEALWPLLVDAILGHTGGDESMDPLAHEQRGGSFGGPSIRPVEAGDG